jgi:hypothetical protein
MGNENRKPMRFRGPSVVALLFGFWALVAPIGFSGWMLNGDGDLGRHLVLGRHIPTHGVSFPDIWSHSKAGETFTAYAWLSEVILAGLEALGGLAGVAIFSSILVAASVALLAVFLRRKLEAGGVLMVGTSAVIFIFPHWITRPHLFSFLFLAGLLFLTQTSSSWKRHIGGFLIFAAWANCHPVYVYGMAVYSAFLLGDLLDQYSPKRLLENGASLLSSAAGTFCNPLGWGLHLNVFEHLRDSRAFEMIQEHRPIEWTGLYGFMFFALLAFLIWVISVREKRLPLGVLLPFLASLFAALVAVRYVSLFAVFGFPMMMREVASTVNEWHWKPLERPRRLMEQDDRKAATLPYAAAVLGMLCLLIASSGRIGPFQLVRNSFSEQEFPIEAVRRAREAGLENRKLLNQYRWGGYLLYAWPEQLIFIDGMANFFGSELMEEYQSIWLTQEGWKERLEDRGIDLMIIPPNVPLAHEVRKLGGWTVWYEDATATVLVLEPDPPEEEILTGERPPILRPTL